MVLKDPDGRYVMADDPRLDPVFSALAKQGRTLVAHLGEPRNCWLPVDQMTVDGDRRYFAAHPEYHGLLHPEIPNYEAQVAARDRMLERHPALRVVGCHLGSLEYDVDELAKRLDKYPNLAVDLSARIVHLQIQPRNKVRAFLVKYQDRLLYGTDAPVRPRFGRGRRGPDQGAGAAGRHLRVRCEVVRDRPGTGVGERASRLHVAWCRAAGAGPAEALLRERAQVVSGDVRPRGLMTPGSSYRFDRAETIVVGDQRRSRTNG